MRYLLIISFLLYGVFSFSQQEHSFVKKLPDKYQTVNDFGKFLSRNEKDTLDQEMREYLKRTTNAIVVVTLESLTDPQTDKTYTIEEAALAYFNAWGVGDKEKNNGVMLMISREPRKVRIQVGTGLENILTNESCQAIIDNNLVPDFKEGLFYPGLKEAIKAIENLLDHPAAADQQQAVAPHMQPAIVNRESVNEPFKKKSPVIGFSILGGILLICILYIKYGKPLGSRLYASKGYYPISSDWNSFHRHSSGGSSGGGSYGGGSSRGGGASGSW